MDIERFKPILLGAIASIVLLLFFGVLQENGAKFLNLSPQWIFISILPLLVALFVGGYISKFKGFGVELESALKATVTTSVNLEATDALSSMFGDEKQSMNYLRRMPREKAQSIKWLTFIVEKNNYYSQRGIQRYLETLINVDFFEIKDSRGNFICYIPVSAFFENGESRVRPRINEEKLDNFIESLEQNTVIEEYSNIAISVSVNSRDSLVNVLRVMRNENIDIVAVVTDEGRYLGVAFSHEVEKKVADAVLSTNISA